MPSQTQFDKNAIKPYAGLSLCLKGNCTPNALYQALWGAVFYFVLLPVQFNLMEALLMISTLFAYALLIKCDTTERTALDCS